MKKTLLVLALAGLFAACGNGTESTGSDTTMETSTTPPPTVDTTGEIGVMMGDTTINVYDSVDGGED